MMSRHQPSSKLYSSDEDEGGGDDSFSSDPPFDSPEPIDDDDEEEKEEEEDTSVNKLNDEESQDVNNDDDIAIDLATQPTISTTTNTSVTLKTPTKRKKKGNCKASSTTITSTTVARKKRKVSISPTDTLAKSTIGRKSTNSRVINKAATACPNSSTTIDKTKNQNSCQKEIIHLMDEDDNDDDENGKQKDVNEKTTKRTGTLTTCKVNVGQKPTINVSNSNVDREKKNTKKKKIVTDVAAEDAQRLEQSSKARGNGKVDGKKRSCTTQVKSSADASKVKNSTGDDNNTDSTNISSQQTGSSNTKSHKKAKAKAATSKTNNTSAQTDKSASNKISTTKVPVTKKITKKKRTFQDDLLQQMFINCRPYTMRDIIQLMQKDHPGSANETAINFCLLSLLDKQWVMKKEFTSKNRTKELYWANHECKSKELWSTLQFVPVEEIHNTRRELGSLQQHHKGIQQELAVVLQEPSNEDLDVQFQTAETEIVKLQQKLSAMKRRIAASNDFQTTATQQRQKFGFKTGTMNMKKKTPFILKKKINHIRDVWQKRKIICMDFVEQLADGMEKKPKDVIKILEIETDESEGVVMPPKHNI